MELQIIQDRIYQIRGLNVMLDFDLAELYGVKTKALKQAVKRNIKRFPPDFMIELNQRLESFMIETNMQFNDIYQALTELASKKEQEEKPRNPVGYTTIKKTE